MTGIARNVRLRCHCCLPNRCQAADVSATISEQHTAGLLLLRRKLLEQQTMGNNKPYHFVLQDKKFGGCQLGKGWHYGRMGVHRDDEWSLLCKSMAVLHDIRESSGAPRTAACTVIVGHIKSNTTVMSEHEWQRNACNNARMLAQKCEQQDNLELYLHPGN